MSNDVYKRKSQAERDALFARLARDIEHSVINITPPKDKEVIKKIRKDHGLNGKNAATICGVTRRTWTSWENYKNEDDTSKVKDKTPEPYPNDWQWGWFLLAINKHPKLRLIKQTEEALNRTGFGMKKKS